MGDGRGGSGGINERGVNSRLEKLKLGTLSQVAIMHALEAAGHRSNIVHPDDDAFNQIDLTIGGNEVIQVKGMSKKKMDMTVLEIDEVVLPGLKVKAKDGKEFHITDYLAQKHSQFREKIKDYQERLKLKEPIKGYMIAVPYERFDSVTGVPDEDFVNFVKDEVKKM